MRIPMIARRHASGPTLRILTWNCQMALRKKHELLASLRPDIAVIQECERPDKLGAVGATAVHWHGDNPHKGLAVLTFGDWRLEPAPQLDPEVKFVLPVRITGGRTFHLLGVWAKAHPKRERSYIGQVHRAVQVYGAWLGAAESVVVGDWNSNAQWDSERTANHSATVAQLAALGLVSAYHEHYSEAHGAESRPTLHLLKQAQRPFHIDYCFIPQTWASHLRTVTVGSFADWRAHSDHCPLVVEVAV